MDRRWIGLAGTALGLGALTGCPQTDSRTSNQGGGSIVSATGKVAGEEISALTPDEIQILADTAVDFIEIPADIPASLVEVSDEEAQAVSDFLVLNDVFSIADLEALIQQAQEDPDSVQIPPTLAALIESGAFN